MKSHVRTVMLRMTDQPGARSVSQCGSTVDFQNNPNWLSRGLNGLK